MSSLFERLADEKAKLLGKPAVEAPVPFEVVCDLTCAHPWYAPEDVRWQLVWDDFHEHRRRRQAWIGPPALGPVLEEAIFSARRASLHQFTARLAMAARASRAETTTTGLAAGCLLAR